MTGAEIRRMTQRDLPEVVGLDEQFFGASRERILRRVLYDFPDLCFVTRSDSKIVGYIMAKVGKGSHRVGPWICEPKKPEIAESLLHRLMGEASGHRLWVGAPGVNKASVMILKDNGFEDLPSSLRMCYGDCRPMGDSNGIFGIGAPDKG